LKKKFNASLLKSVHHTFLTRRFQPQENLNGIFRWTGRVFFKIRPSVDQMWAVFLVATGLADERGTEVILPRITKRQNNRPNPEISEPEKF
jgi:hypothetical protein